MTPPSDGLTAREVTLLYIQSLERDKRVLMRILVAVMAAALTSIGVTIKIYAGF